MISQQKYSGKESPGFEFSWERRSDSDHDFKVVVGIGRVFGWEVLGGTLSSLIAVLCDDIIGGSVLALGLILG